MSDAGIGRDEGTSGGDRVSVRLDELAGPAIDGAVAAVSVPASTANLGPGFDAFGAALSLRTTVTALSPGAPDRLVTTELVGLADRPGGEVPTDERNLVWQGLLRACEDHGWEVPSVRLHVRTAIPMASGLGSSSAAIVAGIALARLLAGADASVPHGPDGRSDGGPRDVEGLVGDLALLRTATAIEGHPDNVAPALCGGVVVAAADDSGRFVPRLAPPPAARAPVMLVPRATSSTEQARAIVPDSLDRADVVVQTARAGHVVGAMLGAWPADSSLVGDRLHEPSRTARLGPGRELLAALRAAGHPAWLSGAGPSIAMTVPAGSDGVPGDVMVIADDTGHEVRRLAWDRHGARACVTDGCGIAGTRGCLDCPLGSLP